jgi:hypothetical protein
MKIIRRNGRGVTKGGIPHVVDGKVIYARFENGNVVNGPMVITSGV